jgi:hypothetical protein
MVLYRVNPEQRLNGILKCLEAFDQRTFSQKHSLQPATESYLHKIPVEVKFILLLVVVRVFVHMTVFLNDGSDNRNPKAGFVLGFR